MLQLLKHYCSVFEGMMLFSDVYVPQYQAVIEQMPGKLGISYFRKACLEHALFHGYIGEEPGLGHVLLWIATEGLHKPNIHLQA